MRIIAIALFMIGCGSDSQPNNSDGPGGGSDGPPAVDAPPITLDCGSYCSAIVAACTGTVGQYDAMAECLGTCEHMPVGTMADTTGDTLGCRVYHTGLARLDPAT